MNNTNTFLPLISTILFVAMIAVNVLANALPINGLTTGQVSDLYPSLFTPAGITFSIWSVIYFFLAGCIIMAWTNRNSNLIHRILPLFNASCILNSLWIIVWHHLLPAASVIIMIALLSVLIITFRRLDNVKSLDKRMKVWLKFPFTIYLAWISVATIANISALLVSLEWTGGFLSEGTWAVVMVFAATAIAFVVTSRFDEQWYSVVVIWALMGIFIKRQGTEYDYIAYTSIIFAVVLIINIYYSIRKPRNVASIR
jgi:translocator protein